MTRPRKALISLETTPFYHVTSRCVRQAYLCGFDRHSGRSYEHRRQWIVDRIRLLSSLFAIDVCAYAVMSNHYHLVLKLCPNQALQWSDDQVMARWCTLFQGPLLVQRYRAGVPLSTPEMTTLGDIARVWRSRLASISWFMRCLNQPIARQANIEDGCTGKFWECRFSSQALKTEEALLSCMAYVDLNPIRAGMSTRPEDSEYTSIRERIAPAFDLGRAIREQRKAGDIRPFSIPLKPLLHFEDSLSCEGPQGIPIDFSDYLGLVEWTGRIIRTDKRGHIDPHLRPILVRIGIPSSQWLTNTTQFEAIHARRFNRSAYRFDSG